MFRARSCVQDLAPLPKKLTVQRGQQQRAGDPGKLQHSKDSCWRAWLTAPELPAVFMAPPRTSPMQSVLLAESKRHGDRGDRCWKARQRQSGGDTKGGCFSAATGSREGGRQLLWRPLQPGCFSSASSGSGL